MKKRFTTIVFALAMALVAVVGVGLFEHAVQAQSPYYPGSQATLFPNYGYNSQTFTATSQTGTAISLGGVSFGTLRITGAATAWTVAVQGSNDGGANYSPLPTAAIATPGTVLAAAAGITNVQGNGMYIVNLAGLTNVRFVTSGTFTGASIILKLTTTSNKGGL